MTPEGWYYLHANGTLHYKGAPYTTLADFYESDLVRAFWSVYPDDRESAWNIVVEALAAGANAAEVAALAERWACTDDDAQEYASRVNVRLFRDGDQWCATREDFVDLGGSPAGFGTQAYEALADLARSLGYVAAKPSRGNLGDLANR